MSAEAVAYALKQYKDLNSTSKMVLVTLAQYHNQTTGVCKPTIERLAKMACMARTTVYDQLRILERLGYIEVIRNGTKGNGYTIKGFGGKDYHGNKQPKELLQTMFNDFWTAYPRKVGKHAAQQAFFKLKPSEALTIKIIEHVIERSTYEWSKLDPQYIPHASTFLNQRRWEDEVQKPKATEQERFHY